MKGLLSLNLYENDRDNRKIDIVEYIYTSLNVEYEDVIYIIDHKLDPYKEIFYDLIHKKSNYESNIWTFLISEICETQKKGNILFITTINIKEIKSYETAEAINNNYIKVRFPDKKNIFLEFLKYKLPKRDYGGKFPLELHDRWILKKSNKGIHIGLHLGTSLFSFYNKDLTITVFDYETLLEAIKRFEGIWRVETGISL